LYENVESEAAFNAAGNYEIAMGHGGLMIIYMTK
jgi:hypothetical protein